MNNLKKELINGKGYAILPIDDLENFKILCDEFIKKSHHILKRKIFLISGKR